MHSTVTGRKRGIGCNRLRPFRLSRRSPEISPAAHTNESGGRDNTDFLFELKACEQRERLIGALTALCTRPGRSSRLVRRTSREERAGVCTIPARAWTLTQMPAMDTRRRSALRQFSASGVRPPLKLASRFAQTHAMFKRRVLSDHLRGKRKVIEAGKEEPLC
jgi:hypothetical protein